MGANITFRTLNIILRWIYMKKKITTKPLGKAYIAELAHMAIQILYWQISKTYMNPNYSGKSRPNIH